MKNTSVLGSNAVIEKSAHLIVHLAQTSVGLPRVMGQSPDVGTTAQFLAIIKGLSDAKCYERHLGWLINQQHPEGYFCTPEGGEKTAVTIEVLNGFSEVAGDDYRIQNAIYQACEWLFQNVILPGSSKNPAPVNWARIPDGDYPFNKLLGLTALWKCRAIWNKPDISIMISELVNQILGNRLNFHFEKSKQFSDGYALLQYCLQELGQIELAASGMRSLGYFQNRLGIIPAYPGKAWFSIHTLMIAREYWVKTQNLYRVQLIDSVLEKFQNLDGSFYGSYGVNATFHESDIFLPPIKYYLECHCKSGHYPENNDISKINVSEIGVKRLAIVPSDPLDALVDKGRAHLLAEYYNPLGFFDEVYCFSHSEKRNKFAFGMEIIPANTDDLLFWLQHYQIKQIRAYGGHWPAKYISHIPLEVATKIVSVHDDRPSMLDPSIVHADHVIAVSQAVANLVLSVGVSQEKVQLIPNYIDEQLFRVRKPEYAPKYLQGWEERTTIFHVGRKTPQKNLDTLLRSLKFLDDSFVLLAAGHGDTPYYLDLVKEMGLENRVRFVDSILNEDIAEYYSYSNVTCIPSRSEGFGVALIEAMACGTVLVSSNIPPINELIEHLRTGILVDQYEDPGQLAWWINEAATNAEIYKPIKKNAAIAVKPFQKEAIQNREIQFYQNILR